MTLEPRGQCIRAGLPPWDLFGLPRGRMRAINLCCLLASVLHAARSDFALHLSACSNNQDALDATGIAIVVLHNSAARVLLFFRANWSTHRQCRLRQLHTR